MYSVRVWYTGYPEEGFLSRFYYSEHLAAEITKSISQVSHNGFVMFPRSDVDGEGEEDHFMLIIPTDKIVKIAIDNL